MATNQELQDQLDEIRQKRADLASQVTGLNIQHSNSNAHLLGSDFAAMDKIRFNSALKPLLMQDRTLHQQEQQLTQAINKTDREQRQAVAQQNAADRASAQAQKAQNAQVKQAQSDLEDQSARAFGLGPKKGIDYVSQQNAFYDPATGQVGVPVGPAPKTPAEKAQKGDANAGKQVQAELTGFAKQQGIQGPVNPASFFDENGFDMEQDKDGNYVYDVNGQPLTIPAQTAERLQDQYNQSLPPPAQEEPPKPGAAIKYIPADAYQKAFQANEAVRGPSGTPDVVNRYLNSQSINRRAAPAVAEAESEEGGVPRPSTVPSVNDANPDLATTINSPSGADFLNSLNRVDPVFAQIAARNKAAAETVPASVIKGGGLHSVKDVYDATDYANNLGITDPKERAIITQKYLDNIDNQNQAAAAPYDAVAKAAGVADTLAAPFSSVGLLKGFANLGRQYAQPVIADNASINAATESSLPIANPPVDEARKQALVDLINKGMNADMPDVNVPILAP